MICYWQGPFRGLDDWSPGGKKQR